MKIETISSGVFKIEVIVKEIKYGNTYIDKLCGIDDFEVTTLKLRCNGCTVMVFRRDFNLFKDVFVGETFSAIVEQWKGNVYTFKKIVNRGIVKTILDKTKNDFEDFQSDYFEQDHWLIDVSGTDDAETMSDVYWNLD